MSDEQNIPSPEDGPKQPGLKGENMGNTLLGCIVGLVIAASLFWTMLVYSLGHGDDSAYAFLVIPVLLLAYAFYAIFRQKRRGFAQGLLIATGIAGLLLGLCFMG